MIAAEVRIRHPHVRQTGGIAQSCAELADARPLLDVSRPVEVASAPKPAYVRVSAVNAVGTLNLRSVMTFILWIIAVILVVSGIFALIRKQLLWGIVLIVVGLLVGPGGTSIFT